MVAVIFTVVAILLVEMAFLFFATNRANFAPRDVVCILFCATHKSLTLGELACALAVASGYLLLQTMPLSSFTRHPHAQHRLCGLS